MNAPLVRLLGGSLLAGLLFVGSACGSTPSADGPDVGAQPTTEPSDPDGEAMGGGQTGPKPSPGNYPDFVAPDYDYTLKKLCFCAGGGQPVRVSVRDGEVTKVAYLTGKEAGRPAPLVAGATMQEIIDVANRTDAAQLVVRWPQGQDYPASVQYDGDRLMSDDEITYTVSDVSVVNAR